MTIKSLENKLHEENLVHQSIIKHHIDEDQVRTTSFFLSLSPFRQSCFTLLQEKNTKIESLAAQVADLTQQVQMQEQLKKDLIQEKAASASQVKEQHEVSSGSLVLDIRRVLIYLRVSTEKQKKFEKEDNSIELQVCMSVFYVYMYGFYYLTCFFPCRGGTAANVSSL